MSRLDRMVIAAVCRGDLVFGTYCTDLGRKRFARWGETRFCKQVINDRWHLCLGGGHQLRLGLTAHVMIEIARTYSQRPQATASVPS